MNIYAKTPDGTTYIDSEFLLNAYGHGLFPMADGVEGEIQWFSPERRGIIPLDGLKISRSLRRTVREKVFTVTVNADFTTTIMQCANREDVWISPALIESYVRLHRMGFAHSVESWSGNEMVGGLYGVAIGGAFFGESMFSKKDDASKVALVHLVERLRGRGYSLLDTQYVNPHLTTLGCIEISKEEYRQRLQTALEQKCTFI